MLKKYLNSKTFYPYELYSFFIDERRKRIESLKEIWFQLIWNNYKRWKDKISFNDIEHLPNIEFSEIIKNYWKAKEKKEYKKREKWKWWFIFSDEKPHFDINWINVWNIYFENVKVWTYNRQMYSDWDKYKYKIFLNNDSEIINDFLHVFKWHYKDEWKLINEKYYEIYFSYFKVKD